VKKKSVFLGGPIQYAIEVNGHFNHQIRDIIEHFIKIMENKDIKVFSAHLAEEFGALTPNQDFEQICSRDFNWMNLCDIYMAILPSNDLGNYVRSDGTYIELGWASSLKKPIILIGDKSIHNQLSMLVRGLGAITYLKYLDINEVINMPEIVINAIQFALAINTDIVEEIV
jgi:nucleoside 2-deoxyribosyltransferase